MSVSPSIMTAEDTLVALLVAPVEWRLRPGVAVTGIKLINMSCRFLENTIELCKLNYYSKRMIMLKVPTNKLPV